MILPAEHAALKRRAYVDKPPQGGYTMLSQFSQVYLASQTERDA